MPSISNARTILAAPQQNWQGDASGLAATFKQRLQDALRRRMFPNTALQFKQLASAIGCSETTAQRWRKGETTPSGDDVSALADFFASSGDYHFLGEIFGQPAPALDARAAHELQFWCTEDGVEPAPYGAGDFVRRYLGWPAGTAGDDSLYGITNLGWVELGVAPSHDIRIRFHALGVRDHALGVVVDWLGRRRDEIRSIDRTAVLHGRQITRRFECVETAIEAICQVIDLSRKSDAAPSKIERLSRDAISEPLFQEVARAWSDRPAKVLDAIAGLGLMPRASIFQIDGDNVVPVTIGSALELPRDDLIGQPLPARPDLQYAMSLQDAVLQAKEGLTYTEVKMPVFGIPMHYRRIAGPLDSRRRAAFTLTQRMAA